MTDGERDEKAAELYRKIRDGGSTLGESEVLKVRAQAKRDLASMFENDLEHTECFRRLKRRGQLDAAK
jgi:UDP-N-acetylmuramyl tripeptide synthase